VERSTAELEVELAAGVSAGWALTWKGDEPVWLHADAYAAIRARSLAAVDGYHEEHAAFPGIPREQLRGSTGWEMDPRFFAMILEDLMRQGDVALQGDLVKRPGFEARLNSRQNEICEQLEALYRGAGLQPPLLAECEEQTGLSAEDVVEGVDMLVRSGGLIRVKGGLCFSSDSIDGLRKSLVEHLQAKGQISTLEFKELTGCSRKFTIPLGEHFDSERLTVRVGDNTRRLR
jgi:selenocysteine-specific elongation factor